MLTDHFPLVGLRLRTPRLELRLPGPEELAALADVAAEGVHDPAEMPFTTPWTDLAPAERALSVIQFHWTRLGANTRENWGLPLTVLHDGVVVGQQDISAKNLAVRREVGTGSWLGRRHHGKGIGTEMRAAVLHLAFEGLGVVSARSAAFETNPSSLAVSRKLGYELDGIDRDVVRGGVSVTRRLRLGREAWERHRTVPVTVEGLAPCLPMLGLPGA
ncbi:putative succinyl-CoA transferase [Longispora fulva]|uniref:RimJ/RimL family protein N-acetyltransferase n=1 Tax=Longispora fulva TaxID=619741 RepID=A0A8J7GNV2_9ACTN|nr:GNAT family N-acetyltransferase [Longispora fulva]MBG6140617.1 RimJ/RimL family protein N-acetyltransferase [Longispora fulva]GIG57001.1 putative succinyl-CoA transferase [Longispora fulva]